MVVYPFHSGENSGVGMSIIEFLRSPQIVRFDPHYFPDWSPVCIYHHSEVPHRLRLVFGFRSKLIEPVNKVMTT